MWIFQFTENSDLMQTYFATEADAYQGAAAYIYNEISDNWDFSWAPTAAEAKVILTHIKNMQYKDAIDYWNVNNSIELHVYKAFVEHPQKIPNFSVDDFFDEDNQTEPPFDHPVVAGKITIPAPPMIDNHTCISCGNAKCSTNEKSCWRCGALI